MLGDACAIFCFDALSTLLSRAQCIQGNMIYLDNDQPKLSNLIGQLQVHYFTYESLEHYEPGIMWSDSIGQFEVHYFTYESLEHYEPGIMWSDSIGQFEVHYFTYDSLEHYEPGIMWSDSIGLFEVHFFNFYYEPRFKNCFLSSIFFQRENYFISSEGSSGDTTPPPPPPNIGTHFTTSLKCMENSHTQSL